MESSHSMSISQADSSQFYIRLFGSIAVEVDGLPIPPLHSRKGLWLLALLTLRANREISRSWLAGNLWPDSDESKALGNLRRILTDLRKALGVAGSKIESPTSQTLLIRLLDDEADVLAFDSCIRRLLSPIAPIRGGTSPLPPNNGGTSPLPPNNGGTSPLTPNNGGTSPLTPNNGGTTRILDPDIREDGQRSAIFQMERAAALYRAPLLDDCYEVWAAQEQDSRRESYLILLERLAELKEDIGAKSEAVRYLRIALSADPSRESIAGRLMETLARNGDAASAGEVYRALRAHLNKEMNTDPSEDIRSLYKRLLNDARSVNINPTSIRNWGASTLRKSNRGESLLAPFSGQETEQNYSIPNALTPLIGRTTELKELAIQLTGYLPDSDDGRRAYRLITLTGPGGIGKTRLSMQTGYEQLEKYEDGVWFVELAPLRDDNQLEQALIDVLGLRENQSDSQIDILLNHLRSRSTLLILDNCEHLLQGIASLAGRLLSECPGLQFLATSRQPLGITGELVWRVPSLALPPLNDQSYASEHLGLRGLEKLSHDYASVQLFSERARSIQPAFSVTESGLQAIIGICNRLDGIPLAIELASARVKFLTVEQIAARLDNRFHLLTGGSRDALPRQQSLRALVDWSYDLLTPQEQQLLCRMSVFAGGFTLETAELVCSDAASPESPPTSNSQLPTPTIDDWEVMDLLAELADKSLITVRDDSSGMIRFGMLETIRLYCIEKLDAAGMHGYFQRKHCHVLLKRIQSLAEKMKGESQKECLQEIETDIDNIRAALLWSLTEQETPDTAMNFCGAMNRFWVFRGYHREGSSWCERALMPSRGQASIEARSRVLSTKGTMAMMQGDYPTAYLSHAESLELHRKQGNQQGIAAAMERLGIIAYRMGKLDQARSFLEESIAIGRKLGDTDLITAALINLGCVAEGQENFIAARLAWEEALELARLINNRTKIALALANLAIAASSQKDYARARLIHMESLELMREAGDKGGVAIETHHIGTIAVEQGEYETARMLQKEAMTSWRDWGNKELMVGGIEAYATLLVSEADSRPELAAENHKMAAKLLGSAEIGREFMRSPLTSATKREQDRTQTLVKSALGEIDFAAAWNEGRSMTPEEAVADALAHS